MKTNTLENCAKFFYDCGKVTFAVLVVGVITRKPFVMIDLAWGIVFTLILFSIGVILNQQVAIKET